MLSTPPVSRQRLGVWFGELAAASVLAGGIVKDDFKARVEKEWMDESTKLRKLSLFVSSQTFPALPVNEQARLRFQLMLMREFVQVLRDRIDHDFQ